MSEALDTLRRGLLLGLDVGGSRTRALLARADGEVVGYGEAGAGNHEVVGYDGLVAAMKDALAAALAAAKAAAERNAAPDAEFALRDIVGAGFGVAGFDWESERPETMAAIKKLGLGCPVELRNDAALGLAAISSSGWGVNIASGTSNNCYGLGPDGREGRIAGAGAAAGENGGAAEIVGRAIVAVNHERILRGPATSLSRALCEAAGVGSPDELVEGLAMGSILPKPAWAPLVFAAAQGGDAVASGILAWASSELGESAAAVIRQLGLEGGAFDVVLSGSLFGLDPSLEPGIACVISRIAPRARLLRLQAPPVVGAVVLAARAAGLDEGAIRKEGRIPWSSAPVRLR
jgi:Predicted N-acetylglucosamine kinase